MKKNYPPPSDLPYAPPDWDYSPVAQGAMYRASWSGYITFELENNKLKAGYTQDSKPKMEKQNDEEIWIHIIEDIASLGFHELELYLDGIGLKSDVGNAITKETAGILDNIIDCVALPGNAVFKFDTVDMCYLGLRSHLSYK